MQFLYLTPVFASDACHPSPRYPRKVVNLGLIVPMARVLPISGSFDALSVFSRNPSGGARGARQSAQTSAVIHCIFSFSTFGHSVRRHRATARHTILPYRDVYPCSSSKKHEALRLVRNMRCACSRVTWTPRSLTRSPSCSSQGHLLELYWNPSSPPENGSYKRCAGYASLPLISNRHNSSKVANTPTFQSTHAFSPIHPLRRSPPCGRVDSRSDPAAHRVNNRRLGIHVDGYLYRTKRCPTTSCLHIRFVHTQAHPGLAAYRLEYRS